jgi:hypothetical protein
MSSTPGPWVWKRLEYDQPHVPEFTLEGPHTLCRYWGDEQPSADAVLIAAAPDLLEALQAIVSDGGIEHDHDGLSRDDMLAVARAAIAKLRASNESVDLNG